MNETDFDALVESTSPQEAKRLWKVLSQWCEGDENSFPVHLALLTRAQWRAAARIPQLVKESSKLMELKLAESRQQTAALVKEFARTADAKTKNLENIVTIQTNAMNQAANKVQAQLDNAETVAEQIKSQLEAGVIEWKRARADFEEERHKLERARKELDARVNRRDWLWFIVIIIGLIGIGVAIGMQIAR